MRISCVVAGFLFIQFNFNLQALEIDPQIQKALQTNKRVRVILSLKDKLSTRNSIRKSDIREIKRALMVAHELSSKDVLNSLESFTKSQRSKVLDRNWASNSLWIEAEAATIERLSKRQDIEQIALDREIKFQKPVEQFEAERSTEEWTYGLKKIGVPQVRKAYGLTGEGIRVGILDTGIDPEHPDLKGKIIAWKDFAGWARKPKDSNGHGTHCAGTIAGGNASGQSIGVAPDVKLIVGRIFSPLGSIMFGRILKSMQWMADPDGDPSTSDQPHIVSNSWGAALKTYFTVKSWWKLVETWRALGILPVFAAGNSGSEPDTMLSPGGFPHSFAVGATDNQDEIAYFSSRGPIEWLGKKFIKPDVTAPGVKVYSAKSGGGYWYLSGTSMACPHVAGVAALLKQAEPSLSVEDLEHLISLTSNDLGEDGKDNIFGEGRVNIKSALDFLKSDGANRKLGFSSLHQ